MNDTLSNIKKVLIVFLICFIGIISYMTYFEIFVGPKIVNNPYNRRLWVKRNEVLRGTIFDRNGKPLTKSERVNQETQKREYTGGEIFAHALGYVDIKYGITGLERKYDEELMATDIQDNLKSLIKNKGQKTEKVGHSLKTSLDFDIQSKAYELLGDNKGAVVALNPKTGEVIAMASKPSFNPNNLQDIWESVNKDKSTPLINRASAGLYPPGSTFKVVTAISALENMPSVRNRTFEDNGSLYISKEYSLHNFAGETFGSISFKNAFVHSSNVVFGTLGLELGNNKLKETSEKFFFNKDIPTDGISVEASKFPTLKNYEKGNIAQSAIGQSSDLASPLQMAVVSATVANGGIMMKPHIVNEVVTNKGESIKTIQPESAGQIISKSTADTVREYMKQVVEEGTGRNAGIDGVEVCGKTGTADHQENGKDAPPHSWFIGFAPYDDPQVAIAVIVENGGQGGRAAATIASEIMRMSLKK